MPKRTAKVRPLGRGVAWICQSCSFANPAASYQCLKCECSCTPTVECDSCIGNLKIAHDLNTAPAPDTVEQRKDLSADDTGLLSFTFNRSGYAPVRLTSTADGVRLSTTLSCIAKAFGVRKKRMFVVLTSGSCEFVKHGNMLLIPDVLRRCGSSAYQCTVDELEEEEEGNSSLEEGDDEEEEQGAPDATETLTSPYESPVMHEAYAYLAFGEKPLKYAGDTVAWKNFKRRVHKKYFINVDGQLYEHRCAGHNLVNPLRSILLKNLDRIVVQTKVEMHRILTERHAEGHALAGKLEMWGQLKYKFRGMREVVKEVIAGCEPCSGFVFKKQNVVRAIITSRVLQLVMFDMFDMPFETPGGYKTCLLIKDHFSKYVWGKAFKKKSMEAVADFIYNVFKDKGCPEQFHCDNGSEFINTSMHMVLMRFGNPAYTHGRPYNPQTQGLIENANGDAILKLTKMVFFQCCTVVAERSRVLTGRSWGLRESRGTVRLVTKLLSGTGCNERPPDSHVRRYHDRVYGPQ